MVASGLSAVGITEDRVKSVTGLSDCGCGKRKEWLNEVGHKYLGIGGPPAPVNLGNPAETPLTQRDYTPQ